MTDFDYKGYKDELIGLRDYANSLSNETSSRLERMSLESMKNAFNIAIERLDKYVQQEE